MAANLIDTEIRKFLPLLALEDKRALLDKIKTLLHISDSGKQIKPEQKQRPLVDYSKYHFPSSAIKVDRGR